MTRIKTDIHYTEKKEKTNDGTVILNTLLKHSIIIICFICALVGYSEDLIILKNGDVIKSSVLEISKSDVKYRKASNPKGPVYTLDTSEILSITFENGEKELFDNKLAETQTGENTPIASEDNMNKIDLYNGELPIRNDKQSDKTITDHAFIYYGIKKNSIISTDEIEVKIEKNTDEKKKEWSPAEDLFYRFSINYYFIKIENKTNKPIYIDLGNTFKVDYSDGESVGNVWYDGKYYSESKGGSAGGNLALGGLTNALGIGGLIGTVSNSLSLGASNQSGITIDKSVQRFMVVPPFSSVTLPGHPFADGKKISEYHEWFQKVASKNSKERFSLKKWELREYSENDSPFGMSYYITFSTDPNFSTYQTLPIHLYTRALYGRSSMEFLTPQKYNIKNWDAFIYDFLYLKK